MLYGKRGFAQISPHPCESAASTLDDHNFLVRTSIRVILDSTESSFSLEFNKISSQPKCRLNIGLGHRQLRNSPFWSSELLFSEPVYNRNTWDCIWPEQGIACWMFYVVFTKNWTF